MSDFNKTYQDSVAEMGALEEKTLKEQQVLLTRLDGLTKRLNVPGTNELVTSIREQTKSSPSKSKENQGNIMASTAGSMPLQSAMINAMIEHNRNPTPQTEQILEQAKQKLAESNAAHPDAAANYAGNTGGNKKPLTKEEQRAQTQEADMSILRDWKNNENLLAERRQSEQARIDALDVRENHIYDRSRPAGRPQSLQADAASRTVMGDFELYGGMDDHLYAGDNRETSFQDPYPGMLDGGASVASIQGMAPTPPGSPSRQSARDASQRPIGQGQDPFLDGMALDSGPQQQAELAAVYDKARLAQEAAYKDRLNPFGAGSGYSDLQRMRVR